MNPAWIACNALVVVASLVCMSYLYYACRPATRGKLPAWSALVIVVTAIVSGAQFVYPEILTALRRDPDAVRAGELWRLVTALFVQPDGVPQCVLNGFLLLAFMPAAERLYGRGILVVYFASGLAGQIVNHLWAAPGSGGSSTAAFGVIGSLLIYILRNRKELLLPFAFIASAALLGAVVMLVFRDGHGVGLLVGAAVASILRLRDVSFRGIETNTFPETSAAGLGRTS